MLTTLITIAAMFTVILVTHDYMLKVIYKNALGESKSHHNIAD
jgi:hypothetical protein